jgi:NitT/TauT family transport system ATP-binding protein
MDGVSARATDPIVVLKGLALAFPGSEHRVLEGLDLAVPREGLVAVVGPSGVGKSTLLRVIAGLLPPSAGEVTLMARPEPRRRPTALVFQDPRLLPWRRVVGNVEFGLEGLIASRAARRARALESLDLVGLAAEAERWPRQLSGGQRQRVGLARALAVDPDLLLMDEPFSALDAITRQALQDELLAVWARTRKSVLFVTHDLGEAVYLADRVVLLGGHPARIVRDETIAARRPRRRESPELAAAAARIQSALGEAYAEGEGI